MEIGQDAAEALKLRRRRSTTEALEPSALSCSSTPRSEIKRWGELASAKLDRGDVGAPSPVGPRIVIITTMPRRPLYQENEMAKLEVSDIARSIKGRIREVEAQLKDHKALGDELERLKGALSRLEGGVRARVDGRGRRQRPVTQHTTVPAPKDTSPARSTNARAPRGQNKQKILAALKGGPKTASEIAHETGIKAGTVGASLSKLAKAGEVIKADRGYALPKINTNDRK